MPRSEVITNFVPWDQPGFNKTPAFKIFHFNYLCMIAQMHLYDTEYLEQGGSMTTGNAAMDRSLAESKVQVQLTIAAMVSYHREGVPFTICNPEDSAKIYLIIREHLLDWKSRVETNPGIIQVPLDDLKALEALAAEIYPHARHYLYERPFHGRLFDTINGIASRRGIARKAPAEAAETPRLRDANPLPTKHSPLMDSVSQSLTDRKKSWR